MTTRGRMSCPGYNPNADCGRPVCVCRVQRHVDAAELTADERKWLVDLVHWVAWSSNGDSGAKAKSVLKKWGEA